MPNKTYIKLDRGFLQLMGEDRRDFLQGIITNDIKKVTEGNTIYACMLTPQGKFLFDFFICMIRERLVIACEKSKLEEVKQKLLMYKLRSKVEITDISDGYSVYAIIGKKVTEDFKLKNPGDTVQFPGGIVFADPRDIRVGARCIIANDSVNEAFAGSEFKRGAREDFEKVRIDLRIPESDKEMIKEKTFPLHVRMDELNAIDFKKGCYVGQEVTARTKHQGVVRKTIMKLEIIKGKLVKGDEVIIEGTPVGSITSFHENHALAMLNIEDVAKNAGKKILAGSAEVKVIED